MNTHNKSIAQLKKMSDKQLLALYIATLGREPSESLSDRQSLLVVLSVHCSEEPEDKGAAIDRHNKTRDRIIRMQKAEARASIPGWKRDWIRSLRYGGRGASWNQIAELTGVHTNVCSAIANGKIYRWDFDSDAQIVVPSLKNAQ